MPAGSPFTSGCSARRALVIGEDLGTVSAELRAKLQQTGLLSYRPLFFEKTPEGELAPPQAYPRDALTCVSTHDLPTWQGYWAEHDLDWRDRVGLTVDKAKERALRGAELAKLERALAREGLERSALSAQPRF